MSTDLNPDLPSSDRVPTFWLWAIIVAALALLLSWFARFPWG
jgi:hypothetical protein